MESIRLNKYLSDAGMLFQETGRPLDRRKKNNSERRNCRNGNESVHRTARYAWMEN